MERVRARDELDLQSSNPSNSGDQLLVSSSDKPRSSIAKCVSPILRFSVARVVLTVALIAAAAFFLLPGPPSFSKLSAQQDARRAGAWLDRPLINWNIVSNGLPIPISPAQSEEIQNRCPNLLRPADNFSERVIVDAGWLLYGPVQSYGQTKVITALSNADDLCRPLGYQAFVYFRHSYVGTLSPVPMDAFTNGDLSTVRLVSPTSISAEFARYRDKDPTGQPTRMSYVTYEVRSDDVVPLLSPLGRVTKPLCVQEPGLSGSPPAVAARLFDVRWRLIELRGVAVTTNNPDITFGHAAKMFSGQGGCNQIVGRFELDGTSLTFSNLSGTRLSCLDSDAQQIETNFIKALKQTTHFELQADILSLYDSDSPLLVFHADQVTH